MMRALRGLALLGPALLPDQAGAQGPPQNPINLFVAELTRENGALRIGTPRNLTNLTGDRGRNSQPAFTPDGRAIVFSAVRDSTGQGDVYRIDLETGVESQVTRTPENENSPTVLESGELVAVRWTPATLFKQWGLWVYGADGVPQRGVLPGPDTVGYYNRIDDRTWALMRPRSRPAVAIFDATRSTTRDIDWPVANLPPQVIPGARAISYTKIDSLGRNELRRFDLGGEPRSLGKTVPGRRVHAWLPDGTVLMARGATVYGRRATGDTAWVALASWASPELQDLAAYVVNREGTRLILTSPRRPPLSTLLRDHVEGGGTMTEGVARVRALAAEGKLEDWFFSAPELTALATVRSRLGFPADSVLLGELSAELQRRR
jgi:hypothetical protein